MGEGRTWDANGDTLTAGLAEAVPTADTVPTGCAVGDVLLLGLDVADETRPLDRVVVAQAARSNNATVVDDLNLMLF